MISRPERLATFRALLVLIPEPAHRGLQHRPALFVFLDFSCCCFVVLLCHVVSFVCFPYSGPLGPTSGIYHRALHNLSCDLKLLMLEDMFISKMDE